ncbi:MAG: DUF4270 domain-containing protein [Bacteroidales bacterium]|nr:DUF4270 domain-containing protein [Bacteroidales bacterium]
MNASQLAKRFILFLLSVPVIFSCTKDLSEIGLDLVSPDELIKLGYSDTISISAFSVQEDSVRTYNLSYALIGQMNDPVFGKTTADWYTQIRMAKEPTYFGDTPVFDSAFLILPYLSAYGDTLSNMTLKVYELSESIIDSVHNYSNHTLTYNENVPLGELTFTPRPTDSAYYSGSTQAPAIRIPLNSAFALKVLHADTSNLTTNTEFLEYFKGIAVIASPQEGANSGAIIKMKIVAGSSKIEMYYHNETDTSTYNFGINTDCKRFNHYGHEDYQSASPMLTQQLEGDTMLGGQFLFMQAMGGIRVKIKFPFLNNWDDAQKVVIHDAQLILTNGSTSSTFTAPNQLALYPVADDGTLYPFQLPDADQGSAYFDGYYNSTGGTYRFRLARYVQQILNGSQKNNGLFLIIPSASIVSDRLVLNGVQSPQSALKLYIKYTVVN